MLVELAVRDLGVIAELRLVLGPGMTVVTGETGAGKTMVVDAIELLVGGRADPALVRTGAEEAWVEGRFVRGGTAHDTADAPDEVVIARAIPRSGRSRAYIDGRLATVTELAALGALLVDLHGQHAHQSLLHPAAQRDSLDRFAGVDLAPLRAARVAVHDLLDELGRLGGDERARARELDLVRYQVEEIEAAGITGPDEDRELEAEEDVLADAAAHREAAALAVAALSGDGDDAAVDGPASASDAVGAAVAALAGRGPFAAAEERLRALAAEVADVAAELRTAGETIDEDPERLEAVRQRRHLLHELRRKYGETLDDVIAEGDRLRARLAELEGHDARAAELDGELAAARAHEAAIAADGGGGAAGGCP